MTAPSAVVGGFSSGIPTTVQKHVVLQYIHTLGVSQSG